MLGTSVSKWTEATLIGLGSQGKAWAANLNDSGVTVSCFLRPESKSHDQARELGIKIVEDLKEVNGPFLLLIPDHQIASFLKESPLPEGSTVIYGHGAALVENELNDQFPKYNHVLLAPKAIATEVRSAYQSQGKLGAVYSVEFCHKDQRPEELKQLTLHLAKDLGITAGPFEVTFAQETRADLLSEQTLLCGLIPYAAKMCFDRLVEEGIPEELAYLEAWHEVKLIGNAMSQKGPAGLFDLISPHALVGAHLASQQFFDKGYQETLDKLLHEINDGTFFKKANSFFEEGKKTEVTQKWRESKINDVFERLKSDLT